MANTVAEIPVERIDTYPLEIPGIRVAIFSWTVLIVRKVCYGMAGTTAPARRRRRSVPASARKRTSDNGPGWLFYRWWPLLLGIAVTPIAVHAASIMALAGSDALGTLYPWILLLKKPAFRFGGHVAENLSQVLMYIQFPVYGLLMAVVLRSKSVWFALGVPVVVHSLAVFAVLLISAS